MNKCPRGSGPPAWHFCLTEDERVEADAAYLNGRSGSQTIRRLAIIDNQLQRAEWLEQSENYDRYRSNQAQAFRWAIDLILAEVCPDLREEFEAVRAARRTTTRLRELSKTRQSSSIRDVE